MVYREIGIDWAVGVEGIVIVFRWFEPLIEVFGPTADATPATGAGAFSIV